MIRFIKALLYRKKKIEDCEENRNVAKMRHNESTNNILRLTESSKPHTYFIRSIHHSFQNDDFVCQMYAHCFEINQEMCAIIETPVLYSFFPNKFEALKVNSDQVNQVEFSKINQDIFEKKIALLMNESILNWSSLEKIEQNQIKFICQNWQKSLNEVFFKPDKMKRIIWLDTIDTKTFDLSKHINGLKRKRLEMFSSCSIGFLNKPNTRLLMRISTQFIQALKFFNETQMLKDESSLKCYFLSLSKAFSCLKNGLFLCLFYVHSDSKMFTVFDVISYPPIYLLESNENEKDDFPVLSIETLSSYCEFCSLRFDNLHTEKFHFKYDRYKLILQSLNRIVQVSFLIRESLIFKKINYNVDVFGYFLYQEVNLINSYLKELNE